MTGYALLMLALCGICWLLNRTFAVSLNRPETRVEQLRALMKANHDA